MANSFSFKHYFKQRMRHALQSLDKRFKLERGLNRFLNSTFKFMHGSLFRQSLVAISALVLMPIVVTLGLIPLIGTLTYAASSALVDKMSAHHHSKLPDSNNHSKPSFWQRHKNKIKGVIIGGLGLLNMGAGIGLMMTGYGAALGVFMLFAGGLTFSSVVVATEPQPHEVKVTYVIKRLQPSTPQPLVAAPTLIFSDSLLQQPPTLLVEETAKHISAPRL